jgi:hypothetical protein
MNTTIKIDPFSSATGAGTLGYYARKYNTSVDNLVKLNPNIKNPNSIQTGADLVVPTISTPSVVTSSVAKKAVNNANDYINKSNAEYTNPNINNTNFNTNTNNTNNNLNTSTTVTDPFAEIKKQESQLNSELAIQRANNETNVTNLKAGLSTQTKQMIDAINTSYDKRIREQGILNESYKGAVNVAGAVSGRSRYAMEYQDQLFNEEVSNGIRRIDDLEAERKSLILKTEQAQSDKEYKAVMELQNQLIEKTKEKNAAVKDLYDRAMSLEKLNMDKSKEARASIQDEIANSETIAKNLAPSIASMISDGQDKASTIKSLAENYGISEDFLNTALVNYKKDLASANPAIIKEYEYMRDNFGYKGSPIDYQKMKTLATRVASKSGTSSSFSFKEASMYDLPEELIGRPDIEVIDELNLSKPPSWFIKSQTNAGHLPVNADIATAKMQWDQFRNSEDIVTFRKTIDRVKTSDKELGLDAGDDVFNNLLNSIENGQI